MDQQPPLDLQEWTRKLAKCIHLELLCWRYRLSVDKLRAFAIVFAPWELDGLSLNFLTDREPFDEAECGKWSIAEWRLCDFTSGPNTFWPYGEQLAREAHEWYTQFERRDSTSGAVARVGARNQLVLCCAKALKSLEVAEGLSHFQRTDDFALYAGHPDEERNFVDDIA